MDEQYFGFKPHDTTILYHDIYNDKYSEPATKKPGINYAVTITFITLSAVILGLGIWIMVKFFCQKLDIPEEEVDPEAEEESTSSTTFASLTALVRQLENAEKKQA